MSLFSDPITYYNDSIHGHTEQQCTLNNSPSRSLLGEREGLYGGDLLGQCEGLSGGDLLGQREGLSSGDLLGEREGMSGSDLLGEREGLYGSDLLGEREGLRRGLSISISSPTHFVITQYILIY